MAAKKKARAKKTTKKRSSRASSAKKTAKKKSVKRASKSRKRTKTKAKSKKKTTKKSAPAKRKRTGAKKRAVRVVKTSLTQNIERHVVKRWGHKETYDERKVYASAYSAALNCHYTEAQAENLAKHVTHKVNTWINDKQFVSSTQIKNHIIGSMPDHDVAVMYKHHLDLC